MLHQNLPSGNYLRVSSSLETEILLLNFSYRYIKIPWSLGNCLTELHSSKCWDILPYKLFKLLALILPPNSSEDFMYIKKFKLSGTYKSSKMLIFSRKLKCCCGSKYSGLFSLKKQPVHFQESGYQIPGFVFYSLSVHREKWLIQLTTRSQSFSWRKPCFGMQQNYLTQKLLGWLCNLCVYLMPHTGGYI